MMFSIYLNAMSDFGFPVLLLKMSIVKLLTEATDLSYSLKFIFRLHVLLLITVKY